MSIHLQQYIISLIENFTNKNLSSDFTSSLLLNKSAGLYIPELKEIVFAFSVEIILYIGIILIIIQLGYYSQMRSKITYKVLSNTCLSFLYIAYLIIIIQCVGFITNNISIQVFSIFANTYTFSLYTQFIKVIILSGSIVLLFLIKVFSKSTTNVNDLPVLFFMNASFACTLASSTHFVLTLVALEGFSLVLYIMTTTDRTQGGISASVKYFTFGTLGSILLFWGIVHLYSVIPSLHYDSIFFLYEHVNTNYYKETKIFDSLEFASSMIIFGLLIKFGAAPVHAWVADVYTGSHLIVTTYFATVVKFLLFVLFCCFSYHFNPGNIIDFVALCSLIVGSLLTLRQFEIKRFIAYSSITHVGFLLIGDLTSGLIYIMTYLISSLLFFTVILSTSNFGKELIYLSDLRTIKSSGLFNSMLLVIALASMAGLPPFAGFYGKFLIWSSLIEDIQLFNDYATYLLLFISIIFSLVSIFYYVRVMAYLCIGNDFIKNYHTEEISISFSASLFQIKWIWAIILVGWTILQPLLIELLNLIETEMINTVIK